MQSKTLFDFIPLAPDDPIFGLQAKYVLDTHPNKLNLGVGAYRDEELNPWILPVVRQVQIQIATDSKENHEYLSIDGLKVLYL